MTGYKPDWKGECEISSWEIASGCGRFRAAWILNLQAMFAGLFIAPRRTFAAFMRGRHAQNFYHHSFDDETLQMTVGSIREKLGMTSVHPKIDRFDLFSFCFWSLVATAFSLTLISVPIALIVWVTQ